MEYILSISFIVVVILIAFVIVLKKQYDSVYQEVLKVQDELSTVLNNSHIGVWNYNINSKSMKSSKQWVKVMGVEVDPDCCCYNTFLKHVLPEFKNEVEAAFEDYINERTPIYHIRYKVKSLHHGDIWVEDFGRIIERDEEANPLSFVGFVKDISAEIEEDENTAKRLGMLQAVVNDEKMEFWEWDLEKDLIIIDKVFGSIPGHGVGSRLTPKEFFNRVHEDDLDGLNKELSQFLNGKHPVLNYEFRREIENDNWEWVRVTGVIYQRDSEGRPNHVAGLTSDITEKMKLKEHLDNDEIKVKSLSRELFAKEEVIKNSLVSNTEFIIGIAKEIRSPLNVLLGVTDVMLEEEIEEAQKNHIKSIKEASKLIYHLSQEITDISKIESGELNIMNDPFDVVQLLSKVFRPEDGRCEISYKKLIAPLIYGDSKRLSQVFGIILDNVDHTMKCALIKISVDLIVLDERENIQVTLTTHEAVVCPLGENKFPPIERGVSMVQKIVELMEGKLETDHDAEGNFFYQLSIPYSSVTVESREEKTERSLVPLKKLEAKILIVDDSEANRELIRLYLKDYPFTLIMAKDGIEAVQFYQRHNFDLVLMDIQMPLMDGYEATQIIRRVEKDHSKAGVPIISISAYVMHDEIEKCIDAGSNSTLLKPVKKAALIEELRKFL